MTRERQGRQVSITWIIVADRAQARFLAKDDDGQGLSEVATLIHPESTMKQSECVSDNQGRAVGKGGTPIAFEPKTDWEQKNAASFAKQVVEYLEAGRNSHQFGHIVLIAAPAFLGSLRSALTSPLAAMIELEVSKDYTDCSLKELAEHLRKLTTTKPT